MILLALPLDIFLISYFANTCSTILNCCSGIPYTILLNYIYIVKYNSLFAVFFLKKALKCVQVYIILLYKLHGFTYILQNIIVYLQYFLEKSAEMCSSFLPW